MKRESYQQFAIVAADSAQLLTDMLNAKMYELRGKNPAVQFDGLTARISWIETEDFAEDITDEYRAVGINLHCADCPVFSPILKADGTEDKRIKYGDCPYASYGRTYKTTTACDQLYKMINSGEVRLCLAE